MTRKMCSSDSIAVVQMRTYYLLRISVAPMAVRSLCCIAREAMSPPGKHSKQRMPPRCSVIQIQCKYKYKNTKYKYNAVLEENLLRSQETFQGKDAPALQVDTNTMHSTCFNNAPCTTQYSVLWTHTIINMPHSYPFLPFPYPYLQCIALSHGLMFTCMNNSITRHTQHTNMFPVSIKLCMNC